MPPPTTVASVFGGMNGLLGGGGIVVIGALLCYMFMQAFIMVAIGFALGIITSYMYIQGHLHNLITNFRSQQVMSPPQQQYVRQSSVIVEDVTDDEPKGSRRYGAARRSTTISEKMSRQLHDVDRSGNEHAMVRYNPSRNKHYNSRGGVGDSTRHHGGASPSKSIGFGDNTWVM